MKKIFLLSVMIISFCPSCKKDLEACKNYKEIKGREASVDISKLPQDLKDTLAKHPQLVPYAIVTETFVSRAICHIYYNDLPVFLSDYFVSKSTSQNDTVRSNGKLPVMASHMSLDPSIDYKAAIKQARNYFNFDHTCIAYQLGLYDLTNGNPDAPANYRLVWKIMDSQKTSTCVILDAMTNQVLYYPNSIWVD